MPQRHRIAAAIAVVCCTIAFAAPASAAQWNYSTIDGSCPTPCTAGRINADVGASSVAVVWNNTPQIFYFDVSNNDLRHAWWTGAAWSLETLDGNGSTNGRTTHGVGVFNAAVVWNNQPHVFYHDFTTGDLRHGWWDNTTWRFETLDGNSTVGGRVIAEVGQYNNATVWNGQPHVFSYDSTNGNLRHSWWDNTAWRFETLDGNSTVGGRLDADIGRSGAATVWNNQPHVFSYDTTNGNLRHAWWDNTTWRFENLDGNSAVGGRIDADIGRAPAVTVWNGQPHVWYADPTNGDLRHAWWDNAAWRFETLDGDIATGGRTTGAVGYDSAVTVWNNQPHVYYTEASVFDLRHAWWTGTKWAYEVLDGNSTAGGRTTNVIGASNATLSWNGQPHVWYLDATAIDLRHAFYG